MPAFSTLYLVILLAFPCPLSAQAGPRIRFFQLMTFQSEKDRDRIAEMARSGQNFAQLAREFSTHHLSAGAGGYWDSRPFPEVAQRLSDLMAEHPDSELVTGSDPELGYVLVGRVSADTARQALHRVAIQAGNAHLSAGRGEMARAAFKQAVALDPQSAEAHMLLGYTYRVLGSYEMIAEAKAELRQATAFNPQLSWARFYLARLYIDLGQLDKAREELDLALETEPRNAFFLALSGEVERQEGNLELALERGEKAVQILPTLSLAHYYLGLSYNDLGRKEDGMKELEAAIGCDQVLAEMHLDLGTAYMEARRFEPAIEQFLKAIEMDPLRAESHLKLAKAYRSTGKLNLAEKELKLLRESERMQIQSPYFQDICAEANYETGLIFRARGKLSQARESFQEVLRVKEAHAEAHRQLAEVLYEQDEYPGALEHATRATELGSAPSNEMMQKIRKRASTP